MRKIQNIHISLFKLLNQTVTVTSTAPGTVNGVGIVTAGDGYKVGESLVFNNDNTGGDSAYAKTGRVKGKSVDRISVASSIIENVEIYPGSKSENMKLLVLIPTNTSILR